jgi:hypothetical protein
MSVNFNNTTKPETPAQQPDVSQKGSRVNMVVPDALYRQLLDRSVTTGLSVPMLLRVAAIEYLAKK